MIEQKINLVWLKRDLRLQDQAAFNAAENSTLPYLPIYILEPSQLKAKNLSLRHIQFIYHSILELNSSLKPLNKAVSLFYAEALEVFQYLTENYRVDTIFSYQETDNLASWRRDSELKSFFKNRGIPWKEFQRDGIVRGIRNREGWDKKWFQEMHQARVITDFKSQEAITIRNPFSLSERQIKKLSDYPMDFQKAGEKEAWKNLKHFIRGRVNSYSRNISKPLECAETGSRLSPYLAWGNISIKQVYHYTLENTTIEHNKRAISAFKSRLKWHCHFIQKYEVENRYERECINKGFEKMPYKNNLAHLKAWEEGITGIPMVDACMRSLNKTGWINFRMRAMLVSFLCHHLDIDWKLGAKHLKSVFLDYEPGIHYPQIQMQAGTTGVNTIRIYNPIKQSYDQDPKGIFIKKWIPELEKIPIEFIHEPWKLSEMERTLYDLNEINYPEPIIEVVEAGKAARKKIWEFRKSTEVQKEKKRILITHTRNDAAKKKEASR